MAVVETKNKAPKSFSIGGRAYPVTDHTYDVVVVGAGGAALGIGWIVGGLAALMFALGTAQLSSAFPTAGGLYHWSSILGGRFWGWLTAWLNLIGLITVQTFTPFAALPDTVTVTPGMPRSPVSRVPLPLVST